MRSTYKADVLRHFRPFKAPARLIQFLDQLRTDSLRRHGFENRDDGVLVPGALFDDLPVLYIDPAADLHCVFEQLPGFVHSISGVVQREDIQINAQFQLGVRGFPQDRTCMMQLSGGNIEIRFFVIRYEFVLRTGLLLRIQFPEPFIVPARHADINVVIPRYKAMVTHRAQHGSAGEEPVQLMGIAECRKVHQHFQHDFLLFFESDLLHFRHAFSSSSLSTSSSR